MCTPPNTSLGVRVWCAQGWIRELDGDKHMVRYLLVLLEMGEWVLLFLVLMVLLEIMPGDVPRSCPGDLYQVRATRPRPSLHWRRLPTCVPTFSPSSGERTDRTPPHPVAGGRVVVLR